MSEIQLLRKVLVLADKLLLELDTNRFPFTARKKLREAITAAQQLRALDVPIVTMGSPCRACGGCEYQCADCLESARQ